MYPPEGKKKNTGCWLVAAAKDRGLFFMKRIGKITDKRGNTVTLVAAMADYGNVQKSYNKARKGKRYRKDVISKAGYMAGRNTTGTNNYTP